MTSGAPIYLVSACASGEEFVSAFRRYADRNGVVFIPIAEPLPSGRRGRFALTLSTGGVMIEGEAEIVSSAKTASVLYGRVGMTLKFTGPDELSKIVLGELEKARLVLKPPAPSVPPRPAEVPAEPRPTPPKPAGRVDASNALAECVAIGNVEALVSSDGVPSAAPKIGSQRFVVPSIPLGGKPTGPTTLGGIRPKTPTNPNMIVDPNRPKSASVPPPVGEGSRPRSPSVAPPVGESGRLRTPSVPPPPTSVGLPAPLGKLPSGPLGRPTTGGQPVVPKATTLGMTPIKAAPPPTTTPEDLLTTMRGPAPAVDLMQPKLDMNETMRGTVSKPVQTAKPIQPAQPVDPAADSSAVPVAIPVARSVPTPAAPMPIVQTPAPPIVAAARPIQPEIEVSNEPTDLTEVPAEPEPVPQVSDEIVDRSSKGSKKRRTVIGVAVVPNGVTVLPAAPTRPVSDDEIRDTSLMQAQEPDAEPSKPTPASTPVVRVDDVDDVDDVDALGATLQPQPLRAFVVQATVEEPTPSGDWTMTPGENGPTIVPREKPAKEIPKGPPTGDWVAVLDPSRPDGWTEPSKIEKRPAGELPPGPPESVVASKRTLDTEHKPTRAETQAEAEAYSPKVQIDPTLIEPLQPLPTDLEDDEPVIPPPSPAMSAPMASAAASSGNLQMAVNPRAATHPAPGTFSTPAAGQPKLASASGSNPAIVDKPGRSMQVLGLQPMRAVTGPASMFDAGPSDTTSAIERATKRRMIMIIAGSALAVTLGIVLVIVLGKKDEPKPDPTRAIATTVPIDAAVPQVVAPTPDATEAPNTDPQIAVAPVVDAAVEAPAVVDAAAAAVAVEDPPQAAQTDCVVDIASTPQGAEIVMAKSVLGTTPTQITLPCGKEARLVLRKSKFAPTSRVFTPKPGQKAVRIALARTTFQVKVSSIPAGATITLRGKSMGVTPAVVKLPAFETSTLKISKDGFAPELQKVTPKQNAVTVHTTLKRSAKKGR